ncbi:MAG TPA: DegT/DnrJ/EryC1/StrS family aminotransferase, partial [Bacteroidia bacterium]
IAKRRTICEKYSGYFSKCAWAQLPEMRTDIKESCYHLYPLRIKNCSEAQRDAIIKEVFERDVSVNVHFIPVPMMSFYKALGYDMKNYPVAYDNYSREISLPVFYDITDEQIRTVAEAVMAAVEKVMK